MQRPPVSTLWARTGQAPDASPTAPDAALHLPRFLQWPRPQHILPLQQVDLMLQVAQHDALYSSGRCSNRLQSKKCRYQAQCKSTQSAQPIAAATAGTSALKVVPEDGAMRFFMRLECLECWNDRWRSPSRDQDLSGIDIDSAMLPCMVHLKYTPGKVFRLHRSISCVIPGVTFEIREVQRLPATPKWLGKS